MNLFNRQGFWAALATAALSLFTTFNTYQLKSSQAANDNLQAQIRALNMNIIELNSRIDNLYVIIAKNQGHK